MDPKFAAAIAEGILYDLLASGYIDDKDLENRDALLEMVSTILKKQPGYLVITDYRDTILKKANELVKLDQTELAIILYATFFEHSINGIIDRVCLRNGLTKRSVNEIIRNVNFTGKFTWLLELLKLPKLTDSHLETILKLSERRNAFLHYKFNPEKAEEITADRIKKEELELQKDLFRIKKAITYFRKYESKIIFRKRKNKLKKLLKELDNRVCIRED